MEEPPIINNFEENFGKFIQICANNQLYMWFGSERFLHGHILNKLLSALNIQYETFVEGFCDRNINLPKISGQDYELVGAGFFERKEGRYILYGISDSYLNGPNKEHAEEISKITGLELVI